MPVSWRKELEYWEGKVAEIRRGQVATVRSSATRWAALLTALLGVFSAVAFAGGLNTIDKLDEPWATVVKLLTSVAAGTAVLSIVLLNIVAGGLRLQLQKSALTALQLAEEETQPTSRMLSQLWWGRILAVVTAAFVLGGSILVLWAPPAAAPVQALFARFSDGSECGKPTVAESGELMLGRHNLTSAVEILTVAKCPAK